MSWRKAASFSWFAISVVIAAAKNSTAWFAFR